MNSGAKEQVMFTIPVNPTVKNVEFWMGDVETQMFDSVKREFGKAVKDYTQQNRIEWIKYHPAQCVLNCSQVHWTHEVEQAMEDNEVKGVQQYYLILQKQIDDLVEAVKTKLTKLEKISFNSLIVIDVHARTVVANLGKLGIGNKFAFEWV